MKISELTTSAQLLRGMQIPVAISGENRAVELGQLLDAMAAAVVPFASYRLARGPFDTVNEGRTAEDLPIIYVEADKRFYAGKTEISERDGINTKVRRLYTVFPSVEQYQDDIDGVRQNCVFISGEGALYQYNGDKLVTVGMTEAQAQQLALLVPQKVDSEAKLAEMESAGLIVPGQIYYIPETE